MAQNKERIMFWSEFSAEEGVSRGTITPAANQATAKFPQNSANAFR